MVKTLLLCIATFVLCSSAIAGTESSAEVDGSGPGIFSGTFADALWAVVAFVVLLLVLGKVAWKPLLNNLNARQNFIEGQLKSAEDSRRRAQTMLEDYKEQGLAVMRQATEQAQRQQQQAVEKTREETQAARRRAQEEIESARAAAMEDLWKQTGDIVLRLGSEVLGRTLTEQDSQRLIDQAVARIRQNGDLQ